LLEQLVTLINLGMRRTGLQPGTEDERDPAQVRVAIEGVRALLPLVEDAAGPEQAGAIRQALSQLQLAYVRVGGAEEGGAPGARPAGEPSAAGQPAGAPGGTGRPAGGAEPGGPGPGAPAGAPGGAGGAEPTPPGPGPESGQPGPAQRSGRLGVPGQR
ncbi:MAG TPA: hypothetical protein VFN65_06110, partial [Solirubrobacteraceae bacterium]|nr:hypothetical protein [Solirubrobacteraceae bacterium]